MLPKPSCTLRDVAVHLGLSASTVSRALRNDPRITDTVKKSVARAAARLGYRRDPKLSQLMSHVRATKQRAYQGTLAWLTDHDLSLPQEARAHALYWDPAVRRAEELGYKLECHSAIQPEQAARISRRLHAAGIQGFVIQQFKSSFQLSDWAFNWSKFAVVHSGSMQSPATLDSVDGDDTANCGSLFHELVGLGYRRIGICTLADIEQAMNWSLSAAQRRFVLSHPALTDIPTCLLPDLGPASGRQMARWIKKHRVDCIVSQVRGMKELVESAGLRVPQDIGLAWQGVNPHHQNTGIWQREDIIAATLVETLAAAIEQGRKGLPAVPRLTLIQGTWHAGATCAAR